MTKTEEKIDKAFDPPNQTILIIDDEPANLAVIIECLSNCGFQIKVAQNGEDGIELAWQDSPDLILLDVNMPGIDGLETCRRLKADQRTRTVPVLFMTILTKIEDKVKGFGVGGVDYISKPFNEQELIARVTTHLRLRELTVSLEQKIYQRTRELFKAQEQYRLLFENASDAIFIVQDGHIKFPNPKALEIFGLDKRQLEKKSLIDCIHPDNREVVANLQSRGLTGETILSSQTFRVVNNTKREHITNFSIVAINWEGQPATLNFVRDITEQKELENSLMQAQKLEAVGTLAAGVAHDFNNILLGIQGRISLMISELDSSHKHYTHLKAIEEYVQDASSLTRQLLGVARGGKFDVKPTDMNALLIRNADMFGRTRKEIRIIPKLEENLWNVEVDREQMNQVFLNLFVNAWQAMPDGGDLYLQTSNHLVDDNLALHRKILPGRYIKINVTDNGKGIDEKIKPRIFDPFFTTKRMGKGNGLGLASAYGILKNHRGTISVYSEKGCGTTFSIYLPASDKAIEKEPFPVKEEIVKGNELILLIDDETMVIDVGKQMLERLGYRILTAGSGQAALDILRDRQTEIDLVILDMIMPGTKGSELFDQIKEMTPDLRVLLSSGYSLSGQATEILDRGCDGFIQKPFGMKELSQKIKEILGKN